VISCWIDNKTVPWQSYLKPRAKFTTSSLRNCTESFGCGITRHYASSWKYDRRKSIIHKQLQDGQTLIQHVEIDCEPDLHNFVDSKKPSYPILTTVTCFIKTRCSMADDWEEDFGAFVDWVLRMLPTKHLRWHHTYADDEHTDLVPKLKTQFKLGGQYESIELPPAWQDKLYWNNNALTALVLDAKPLGNCRPSYWYTDPSDADDEAGHIYKKLIDELRDTGSVKNKPMYTVKIARSNETPTTQPGVFDYGTWETEKLDTRSCAILTDLAIMHKMGLANTKIVSIPDEWEPEEWRKWILGEGLVPGNGVLADLKAIEE
jgi:hypothetical protein